METAECQDGNRFVALSSQNIEILSKIYVLSILDNLLDIKMFYLESA